MVALLSLGVLIANDAAKPTADLSLFDGKTLTNWESVDVGGSGAVSVEEGELIISQGENVSGAVYKKAAELPMQNYEISLETMRVSGVDFFCGLTFPVGDAKTCLTLVMGGWGGAITGLSCIDGMDASDNNTSSFQGYKDDQWYKVKLQVRPKEIKVWLDDKEIINTDIEGKKLGLRAGPMESFAPLSLTTFQTTGAFRNIKIRKL
jgi:Domain of Unknown Function (DUF1080)